MMSFGTRFEVSYSCFPEFFFPDFPNIGVYHRDLNSCYFRRNIVRER